MTPSERFGTVVLPWCRNALRFRKPNPRLAAELEEKMKFGTLSEAALWKVKG